MHVGGIVRDRDVAAEAPMDGFTAFPTDMLGTSMLRVRPRIADNSVRVR